MGHASPHMVKVLSGGRITIPAQLRRELGLNDGDEVVIFRRGREIVITRQEAVTQESESDLEVSDGSSNDAVHPGPA